MMKIKKISAALFIYIILCGFVWGFMTVYVKSYNTMNKEQIQMLNYEISESGKTINIEVLDYKASIYYGLISDISASSKIMIYTFLPDKVKILIKLCQELYFS